MDHQAPNITIEDAESAILAAALAHEAEHAEGPDAPFCEHTRAALVGHLMWRLGLELVDIGLVADSFMDYMAEECCGPEDKPEEWREVFGDEQC